MIVHFRTRSGGERSLEVDSIKEAKNGIKLKEGSPNRGTVVGYVPYDRLDYVGPDEDSGE